MSENLYHKIAEQVESGEYFSNAMEWYHEKYSFPVVERSYFIVISIVSLIIGFISVQVMNGFLPIIKNAPIAMTVEDQSTDAPRIEQVSTDKAHDPNILVQILFLKKYLHAFEDYQHENDFRLIENNKNIIQSLSENHLQEEYKALMDQDNQNSYIIKYKNYATKNTRIVLNSISIDGSTSLEPDTNRVPQANIRGEKNIHNAEITFYSDEVYSRAGESEIITTKHKANIRYIYSNIQFNTETEDFEDLDFKIIQYTTKEIS